MESATHSWDHLIINARLATMEGDGYGVVEAGALAIRNHDIAWVGQMKDLPAAPEDCARQVFSAAGLWVTPGLIDCHTHLLFGGSRADEFERRLGGESYESIARSGGGIMSTVRATREASENELIERAAWRVRHLLSEGVTTLEVKSGYGLDVESELKMLRALGRLDDRTAIEILPTFLGAHTIPTEFRDKPDAYVDLIVDEMLPAVADQKLARAVDAYGESIAFSPAQVSRVFDRARELDLPVKLHADQLSDQGGAELAARYNALSADHLEYSSTAGINAMAQAGTIAVLLPGAFHTLRETQMPPISAMRDAGLPLAVATDCNPGTSPLSSIITAMNHACIVFRLTPVEALRGVTLHAAAALGRADSLGSLAVGKQADISVWDIDTPADLAYWVGGRRCRRVYKAGEIVF